jgi:hypothetical protein
MKITQTTRCPICGGRIQATRTEYLDGLVLSADCQEVVSDGTWAGSGDARIYCENDCTQAEMIDERADLSVGGDHYRTRRAMLPPLTG